MAYTTIDNPELYFQTKLYTGNGGTQSITLDGSENMQPDWVWVKQRGGTTNHKTSNSVTGATKALQPNDTDAEATDSDGITSFDSNGFSLGAGGDYNGSSNTQVAWCWKKQAGIFDIVTYTGNGSNRTISHNLGAVPTMMVTKVRSTTNQWLVYHKSMGNTETMKWDDTSAATTQSNLWNSTTPTSSVFSVGTHTGSNLDGGTFVIYLFGDKQGVSKMGSYTGNGNANGTFIYTGFKPAWVMAKNTDATKSWFMYDNKRDPFNPTVEKLRADTSAAEATGTDKLIDMYSNGFKIRTDDAEFNASGNKYIYMCFAENPFVTSTGVPATAR